MFSLKQHMRRHAMMIAAVAATVGFAAASHAATIWYVDTFGTYDPVTVTDDVSLNDDVAFGTLTLNDGGYTVTGNGHTITLAGGNPYVTSSGTNTLNAIVHADIGGGSPMQWNVTGNLTVDQIGVGYYGSFEKNGNGILRVGNLNASAGIFVNGGTLILTGQSGTGYNQWGGGGGDRQGSSLIVYSGSTLAGNNIIGVQSIVQIDGHLAPGADGEGSGWFQNKNGTFGSIGKLTIQGADNNSGVTYFNFNSTSNLDLDLLDGDNYDSLAFLSGRDMSTYGIFLDIYEGAQVNINDLSNGGDLAGTYHIITLGGNHACTIDYYDTNGDIVDNLPDDFSVFSTGVVPPGYHYEFVRVTDISGNFTGIDLVITHVPEPASLGLLGLGSGLLLLRRKRHA
ncbi:MAG: PEP-CTERM sorting domain-containing protein [Phycisphaerales bacterium]|nr:PEP-CTERM sorting domain-containing protein [Phycisphaerales bacterium]